MNTELGALPANIAENHEQRALGLSGAVPMPVTNALDLMVGERRPLQSGEDDTGLVDIDSAIERIGFTHFHHCASAILGIANAADATELMSIGYILPELEDVNDELKGLFCSQLPCCALSSPLVVGKSGKSLSTHGVWGVRNSVIRRFCGNAHWR